MSLSIGIVGLPNVGKSTLFNALLKRQAALAANYPFATIEPNIGVVDVPDDRLAILAEIVKTEFGSKYAHKEIPEKIIPAVVKFYDIAGLVKGASQGEGLGNQFLGHIREVDAILHIVRDFSDENVIRAGATDPKNDIEVINTELILCDLQVLNKKIDSFSKDLKKYPTTENKLRNDLYVKVLETLNKGILPNTLALSKEELLLLKDLNLLTLKPMIYVFNSDEGYLSKDGAQNAVLTEYGGIRICAKVESEIASLSEEDANLFLKELGITQSGLDRIIKDSYRVLGLQTYLTAGPKEVRAWTIKAGDKAPAAAGVIHTDFERGFISAEIISCSDLQKSGGWKKAKELGLIRIEGKNYVMQDGDVVEFHFSA